MEIGQLSTLMWGLAGAGSAIGLGIAFKGLFAVWGLEFRGEDQQMSMKYLGLAFFPMTQAFYPFILQLGNPQALVNPELGLAAFGAALSTGIALFGVAIAQGGVIAAGLKLDNETRKSFGWAFTAAGFVEGIGLVVIGIVTFVVLPAFAV